MKRSREDLEDPNFDKTTHVARAVAVSEVKLVYLTSSARKHNNLSPKTLHSISQARSTLLNPKPVSKKGQNSKPVAIQPEPGTLSFH